MLYLPGRRFGLFITAPTATLTKQPNNRLSTMPVKRELSTAAKISWLDTNTDHRHQRHRQSLLDALNGNS